MSEEQHSDETPPDWAVRPLEIELSNGVILTCYGPQTDSRIYFAKVGTTPEFNNRVIRQLEEKIGMRDINCPVTAVATGSSPLVLIQVEEPKIPWLVERLREVIQEMPSSA